MIKGVGYEQIHRQSKEIMSSINREFQQSVYHLVLMDFNIPQISTFTIQALHYGVACIVACFFSKFVPLDIQSLISMKYIFYEGATY